MNIFYLGHSLEKNSGGIEKYTYTVLKNLEVLGHKIIVHTVNNECKNFSNLSIKRIKYFDKFLLGTLISKSLYDKYPKIDVFLCGHLFLARHMETITNKYFKKYKLFVYGIECWGGRFQARYSHLRNIDKIISISSFTTRQIRKQGFDDQIVYLPPTLELNNYPPVKKDKCKDKISFITVSRLSASEQYKGHDKVIEAIGIIINKYKIENIKYLIVGKGDDELRLKTIVKKLNLEKYVEFYGFASSKDLALLYSKSDVFIMPSNVSLNPSKPEGEGFGIAFIEAAMYELPLIGPNDGGSKDIIDNEVNGLECNPISPNDIAKKMKILVENATLRRDYGKNSKQIVIERFTTNKPKEFYEKIL